MLPLMILGRLRILAETTLCLETVRAIEDPYWISTEEK